jgi:hypothetical protein
MEPDRHEKLAIEFPLSRKTNTAREFDLIDDLCLTDKI